MTSPFLSAKYHTDIRTVDFAAADGSHLLRSGGTIAWRFNNPGNLRPAKSGKPIYGAIGVGATATNGEFLIFASYEDGRAQKRALLRRKYNERTFYTMLAGVDNGKGKLVNGYAPENDHNDPQKYAEVISEKTGLPISTRLSELTDAQLDKVMDAMESHEGYHGQKASRKEEVINTTTITVTDGAAPKAKLPVKLEVAGKTQMSKTNERGQLPPIPHLTIGQRVDVFLESISGEWEKAFDFVMAAESKAYSLTNGLLSFSAPTDLKRPPAAPAPVVRQSFRYPVQPGDTLAKLAALNKTTVAAILRDNPQIKDASKIYPSQVIVIPGTGPSRPAAGKAPPPVAARPRARPPKPTRQPAPAVPVRSKEGSGAPLALVKPDMKRAPWMEVAIAEAKQWKGLDEDVITKTDNYHKLTGGWLKTMVGTENAWCASFVNYCLITCATPFTKWKNSFRARAVALDTVNFVEIKTPVYGCIGLLGTHHVMFVYAKSGDQYVCLGGNQDQQINFSYMGSKLRFFVPIAYHEFAKKDMALGNTLGSQTPDELNKAFGIHIKPKKKKAKVEIR